MAKRRIAEETQDTIPAASDNVGTVETTPTIAAGIAPQIIAAVKQEPPASQDSTPPLGTDGKSHTLREPGEPQKSWVKNACVIVDPEAGVKFHFDYEKHKA